MRPFRARTLQASGTYSHTFEVGEASDLALCAQGAYVRNVTNARCKTAGTINVSSAAATAPGTTDGTTTFLSAPRTFGLVADAHF